jgi:hypothetical protein
MKIPITNQGIQYMFVFLLILFNPQKRNFIRNMVGIYTGIAGLYPPYYTFIFQGQKG